MCPLTTGGTGSGSAGAVDISDFNWERVLDVAEAAGRVFVSGFGEPLTNQRCLELLADLDRRSILTTFVTNGIAVSPAVASALAEFTSLVHVNVSIDSPDPDVYRSLRGGSVDRAWWGLRNLVAAFPDAGSISVSSVAMAANLPTLAAFPERLAAIGVRNYVLQGLFDYNEFSGSQQLGGSPDVDLALDALRTECDRHGIDLVLAMPERTELERVDPGTASSTFFAAPSGRRDSTRMCMLPWELPYVDAVGDVFPCCYAASVGSPPLGRLGEDGLEPVWRGAAYRAFRADLADGRTLPEVCRSCTAVPLGPHPVVRFAAQLVDGGARVRADGRVELRVRNTGTEPWGRDVDVCVGTTGPRDGASGYWHPVWRHPARPVAVDRPVSPGALHVFRFSLHPEPSMRSQRFALVAEGVCWMPGTEFEVEWAAPTAPG